MGDSPRHNRYSDSPSPRRGHSRSRSPVRKDGEANADAGNPGNNLYVTGLSMRVTEKQLKEYFSREGKVIDCRLVVDPRSRASRGFGFVTMETVEDADCCVKYLHRSTLEGRIITVEKAKRKRARTPTPGEYLGVRAALRMRSRGYGGDYRDSYNSRHSPRYSPYRGGRDSRDRSPQYSPYRGYRHDRSRSPVYSPYRR
ncbi:hypothetical protein O6H91_14G082500 [Diphasiastrum complanatum]|uniref:Uncharacterized protein n=1 Tax=Diphasiastrum complanatum TaxID=34168 RepID=A0ACC2BRC9_DIPCM|nr:hypothetical protein O6H91_Y119900 [Diphasiastrum complanatum]KAJ7296487.1 hypothetical protein O6H91_Y119900 [Diphasiastrum complanatum]KAJ7532315.1 hypothetical protein O6H91_14G082500 [Diphasiastrum complanatum]